MEPYLDDTPPAAPDYEAEARAITWGEANRRLAEAAALIPALEEQGEKTQAAQTALAQAQFDLAEAEKKLAGAMQLEDGIRAQYNQLRGTGKAMKASVTDECAAKQVPIPQDPEPANPPVRLAASCDHGLTCKGCLECGCHAAMAQTGAVPLPEPVIEHPIGGAL